MSVPLVRPSRAALRGRLRRGALLAVLLVGAGVPPLHADGGDDHDQARAAVRAGEILPLPVLLERLQRSHPGQVLEIELEREGPRWIYEIHLLAADGRLLRLEVDARTAELLSQRQRAGGHHRGGR